MISSTKVDRAARNKAVISLVEIAEELVSIQLGNESSVTVMELKCSEAGCPPLETAFAVLEKGVDCKFKVMKELELVTRDDVVDAIQAWVRGDAPPCGCEFTVPGQDEKVKVSNGGSKASSSFCEKSAEEMEQFMESLNSGVM